MRPPWWPADAPQLEEVAATELQQGCYCEIDMVVPPLSPEGSGHRFNGTVQEVTHDEVVLINVLEQSNVDYGLSSRQRPLTRQKRDLVRVPRLGIAAIWAYPPGKEGAARLPSNPGAPGQPPPLSHVAPPSSEAPARFDAPPRTGDFLR